LQITGKDAAIQSSVFSTGRAKAEDSLDGNKGLCISRRHSSLGFQWEQPFPSSTMVILGHAAKVVA
ncbi:hypothetical protein ACQP3L_36060, partial [Escherichia coli]